MSLGQIALGSAVTALFHPTGYSKVLIQLGHEPIEPVLGKSFLGFGKKDVWYLPNVFKYTRFIYRTEGFFGLYTGLLPRLIGGHLGNFVQQTVLAELKKDDAVDEEEQTQENWIKVVIIQAGKESFARCVGVVASQPFHVLMIRQMAQFVGGETQYNGLFGGLKEIYNQDGFKGFFSGLVPRLIGEVIQICLSSVIAELINRYIVESKEAQSYTTGFVGFMITTFTYPFTLVSNNMAVAGTDLIVASTPNMKPYIGWTDCYSHLKQTKALGRGSKLFMRTDPRAGSRTFHRF
ncbi:mitochondrial carrier homolog 2-like [Mya arenaria]|uniref:mitochondrial carrier homolog 2-like n=1 Tax=Mya arenaria TaxID=6604 RepID=UPI0022E8B135|nr:mitochondrial carrier homolog 2-like [Mya arenaria]